MRILADMVHTTPHILDVSEIVRPEQKLKEREAFRDYSEKNPLQQRVKKTYYEMHTNQTVDFVKSQHEKWLKFDHVECTIMEALDKLNSLVDESDPDFDLPNIVHAFQTAERIRADYPEDDWFHLVGLIHDLGKIMAFYSMPQWAVVGDTFPVGCLPQASVVYGMDSFKDNKDMQDSRYNTQLGMYEKNCGMKNVIMSWGHDEYLYQVIKNHCEKAGTQIPEGGMYAIRFHSFFPWHTGGDYNYFMNDEDTDLMKWVMRLSQYDLYTKSTNIPDIEALKPYYQSLIDKYLPGNVAF
eukprot:TRINITY_DN2287_c0_g1_i5.p1 TRINITY_DN2287_c0_g1~~TRINITY_DN2287_c0_g1_i5.p1  ORF type:complete len:304 (+),score=69.80 TRINITY_DN2287_c0_g1_i5:25-912(+)